MENKEDQEAARTKMLPAEIFNNQTENISEELLITGTIRL